MTDSTRPKPKNKRTPSRRGAQYIKEQAARIVAVKEAREALLDEVLTDLKCPGTLTKHGDDLETLEGKWREFFRHLAEGANPQMALAIAGLNERWFREWMRRGGDAAHNGYEDKTDQAEEPYRSFALAVRAVQNRFDLDLVQTVKAHTHTDWKAAAWLLERRRPDEFGKAATEVNVGVAVDAEEGKTQVVIYVPGNGREVEAQGDAPALEGVIIDEGNGDEGGEDGAVVDAVFLDIPDNGRGN